MDLIESKQLREEDRGQDDEHIYENPSALLFLLTINSKIPCVIRLEGRGSCPRSTATKTAQNHLPLLVLSRLATAGATASCAVREPCVSATCTRTLSLSVRGFQGFHGPATWLSWSHYFVTRWQGRRELLVCSVMRRRLKSLKWVGYNA